MLISECRNFVTGDLFVFEYFSCYLLLLINQAQPIRTGDEGDREAPYNVLDEESDIETHSIETVWSEAPAPIEEPGEYDRESPPTGEEFNDGQEGPPSGDEYSDQVPPDYQMLKELQELSETYGENGHRMFAEWVNDWRKVIMLDDPSKTEEWFLKVKSTYGNRLVGHKECHRKSFLYLADTKKSSQQGVMPYDEWMCGWDCKKWVKRAVTPRSQTGDFYSWKTLNTCINVVTL